MNLDQLQHIVRRLFTDAEFRAQAIADPGKALSAYHLTAEEHVALGKLCARMADGPSGQVRPQGIWM